MKHPLKKMLLILQRIGYYLKGLLMGWPVETIPGNDRLFRRIPPLQYDEMAGRVTSAAFTDPDLSVNWEKYCTPEKAVRRYPTYRLAAFQAKIPREKNLEVRHTPFRLDQSHSSVLGRKSRVIARFLAQNSFVFIPAKSRMDERTGN